MNLAEESRQLAIEVSESEFSSLLEEIKTESLRGETKLEYLTKLKGGTICLLTDNGFKVDTTYDGYGFISHLITW